jgi:tetratricopeptide (TPR) repeat protein
MITGPVRRIRIAAWIVAPAAAIGVLLAASAAQAGCALNDVAALAVTMIGPRPTVHASIDGKDAVFLVDTGAFASVISPEAADRRHLRVHGGGAIGVKGIGGAAYAQTTRVEEFKLGGAPFYDMRFLVVNGAGRDVAGVLGQDILGAMDVEYDFANGVMRLIRPKGCGAADILSYWTDRPSILPTQPSPPFSGQVRAVGEINGRKIRVGLDSGSTYSGMTLKAAARAGVSPGSPDVSPARASAGIDGKPVQAWTAPFDSFSLGGEAIVHTRLRIGQGDIGDNDMLLGADFFLAHRIYVSRAQHRLYFTYNGGPVFRLRDTPAVAWAVKGTPAGDPNAPVDAAGFARRGAALMARDNPAAALQDFSRAIGLEPREAAFYFDRAAARAADGQPDLALADFDAGLTLRPADPSALLARAALNIDAGRADQARPDLEAAVRTNADDVLIGLEAAGLYERAGLLPEAVTAYSQWIERHPRDELAPEALAGRCRARALVRSELDLAREDCDAAVRDWRDHPAVLASRSLLDLVLGATDSAIADADAALKADDQAFWALQVRGWAKRKLGQSDQAEIDLAAAAKADPKQARWVDRLSFTP